MDSMSHVKMNDNINNNPQSQLLNPEHIGNMMMANIVINKMSELFSTNVSLSFNNICKLFIFMVCVQSKDLIMGSAKSIISKLVTTDKEKNLCYSLINYYLNRKNGKQSNEEFLLKLDDNYIHKKSYFIIATFDGMHNNIYHYIMNNPETVTYQKYVNKFHSQDNKTFKMRININNVSMTIGNYKYNIGAELIYSISNNMGNISIDCNGNKPVKPKTYLDILPPKARILFDALFKASRSSYDTNIKKSPDQLYNVLLNDPNNKTPNMLTTYKLIEMISKKNNFKIEETCFILLNLIPFLVRSGALKNTYKFTDNNKNNFLFLDPYNDYDLKEYKTENISFITKMDVDTIFTNSVKRWGYDGYFDEFVNNTEHKAYSCTYYMNINTIDDSDIEISHALSTFFETINKYQVSNNTKINIHYLELSDNIVKESSPNPKYAAWLKKKEMVDKLPQKESPMGEFLKLEIPEETITTEIIKREVKFKKLNTIQKDIKTLYLKKNDMNRLMSSMIQFRDRKDILQKHGLRNKLNILLYGQPGTGKSTAIEAIATFLGKDIFYVDLKNAKTNHDLQLIFEHVNNNVTNGGIVVIEDIDTMTPIVLQRDTKEKEKGLTDCINGELSLDYFLNILQGTLTMDDSIFIVTTNYFDRLDKAFTRDGRFDIKIELEAADHFQISEIYKDFIGRPLKSEILNKIPDTVHTPATIIYHLKEYIFNREQPDEVIMKRFFSN